MEEQEVLEAMSRYDGDDDAQRAASWALRRIADLEARVPTKAKVEDAAASLFISDGGQEATALRLIREHSHGEDDFICERYLPEVVHLLCHHLGVKE